MSGLHTPGPWSLAPAHAVIGSNGKRVCAVPVRLDDHDVGDLHLIAAAPEMLEALYQYVDDLRFPPQGDSIQRRIERAEAVIAKARGEA